MIYALAIQKGGVAKTTSAAILAQAAAYKGKKALAVDLDPQANLSFMLGADPTAPGCYELLHGTPAADLIQKTAQGVDVLAASWNLATITSSKGSARRLKTALEPIEKKYRYIFIDVPAMGGELQYNALMAANRLVIPLSADIFNLQSLYQITDAAQQIRANRPELEIAGFILTQYDKRGKISQHMKETITKQAEAVGVPYLGAIRPAVVVKEAAALQLSLYEYAPKSKTAADYLAILERLDAKKHIKER